MGTISERNPLVHKILDALWGKPVDQVADYVNAILEEGDVDDYKDMTPDAIREDFQDFQWATDYSGCDPNSSAMTVGLERCVGRRQEACPCNHAGRGDDQGSTSVGQNVHTG
jgi:hypothetical protein